MIAVQNLKKRFKTIEAVKDVSFVAKDGAITALLGDNGAGKTTTIRMIAGILEADAGVVEIEKQIWQRGDTEMHRNIGVLSDAKGLYERLTARENMYYYGSLMQISKADLKTNIEAAVELLEMGDIIDRRVLGFSTGQKMKVLLGRLLSFKPKNLILDEPSAGLDVRATRRLRETLKTLKNQGHCIVFSTHIMQEVEHLCDSVIVMHDGRSLVQDTVPKLCNMTGETSMEETFIKLIEGGFHA